MAGGGEQNEHRFRVKYENQHDDDETIRAASRDKRARVPGLALNLGRNRQPYLPNKCGIHPKTPYRDEQVSPAVPPLLHWLLHPTYLHMGVVPCGGCRDRKADGHVLDGAPWLTPYPDIGYLLLVKLPWTARSPLCSYLLFSFFLQALPYKKMARYFNFCFMTTYIGPNKAEYYHRGNFQPVEFLLVTLSLNPPDPNSITLTLGFP